MQVTDRPYLTPQAYLNWEARQAAKHEYVAGEVYTLGNASLHHVAIGLNLAMALREHLQNRLCQVFFGDVKLRVPRVNAYYYPDLMVCCGEHRRQAEGTVVVDDPMVVVELVAPSTAATDRREKLSAYRSLATMEDYVLVSENEPRVDIYRRTDDVGWQHILLEPGDMMEIPCLGFRLALADIYDGSH